MIAGQSLPLHRPISRRTVLALGCVALGRSNSRALAAPPPHTLHPARDAWFWNAAEMIEAGPPAGGPSAGEIDHSMFAVEAHRAGRANPAGSPPVLEDFYLHVQLEPDPIAVPEWDVGFVWRTNWQMDALLWRIDHDGRWTLDRAIWEYAPRDAEPLVAGNTCSPVQAPVRFQAIVAGSQLAISVNGGAIVVVAIPGGREPGHVGVLANSREEHLQPAGFTPYRELAVWPIDADELPDSPWDSTAGDC